MTTKRGGRPSRTQQLEKIIASSPDLSKEDVRRLLGRLGTDEKAPAHVRVTALRALLGNDVVMPEPEEPERVQWNDEGQPNG